MNRMRSTECETGPHRDLDRLVRGGDNLVKVVLITDFTPVRYQHPVPALLVANVLLQVLAADGHTIRDD